MAKVKNCWLELIEEGTFLEPLVFVYVHVD